MLGFTFSSRPLADAHVRTILDKIRKRIWSLKHLKKKGFNQDELVKVYCTNIRPLAEYVQEVYHTMITAADSDKLDRIEARALKFIYGWKTSYAKMLLKAGIERLSERRVKCFLSLIHI